MSYVQHIDHHGPGYAPNPDGYPSAVPPAPGFFRDGIGPPQPPQPAYPGYQGYFSDGYPPPPTEHIHHYQDDMFCSSFLNTCLAALCCCCIWEQCCRW